MNSPLTALANIISSGIHDLEDAYTREGLTYPSLEDPFHPTPLDDDTRLIHNRRLIVAAAAQIIASVRTPRDILKESVASMYTSATLGFVVDINLPDILKAAGPKGLHVDDISAVSGVDASYLARVLRYLATRHIFQEVKPDTFANNRVSSLLANTKTLEAIKADPVSKYDDAPYAANMAYYAEEGLKSSVHLAEFLKNPTTAASPFNIAFGTDTTAWEWYNLPGNEWRNRRFAAVMKGNSNRFPSDIISSGIDGNNLKTDAIVVDVGGGVGSATLGLHKVFPHLRYVVQDVDAQIEAAQKYWKENCPEAIEQEHVKLQGHSFFNPQPIKEADVYFLRIVTHDWPDSDVRKILKHLRDAAGKSTKLVLYEVLASYTCSNTSGEPVPYPLLGNLGIAGGGVDTAVDMHMLASYNGKERTEADFRKLGQETGWQLDIVKPGILAALIFSPSA